MCRSGSSSTYCTIGRTGKLPKIISEDFPRYGWKHFWNRAPCQDIFKDFFGTIGRTRKLPKIISEDFENILETSIFPRYCQNCWKHFWKWAPSQDIFKDFFSGLLSFSSLSHHDVPCWKYSVLISLRKIKNEMRNFMIFPLLYFYFWW